MSARKALPVKVTSANKCSFCSGSICCTYITQEIATPRSREDFDQLAWQLAHENIEVYKDEDGWHLVAMNRCRHLLPQGGCGIYTTRPQVCRDHSNDYCEYDAPAEDDFELYFRNDAELNAYCRKRFKSWDARFKAGGQGC